MAYNRTSPCTHPVRVYVGKDGNLKIAPVRPETPVAQHFDPSEPEELFETIKEAGLPISSSCFWLAGVTPAITKEIEKKEGGQRTGELIEVGNAYSAEQIAAFSPKGFSLAYTFKSGHGRLLLSCYTMSKAEYLASQGKPEGGGKGGVTPILPRQKAQHVEPAKTTARTRRIGQ
jgi:hypothetical protein